MSKPSNGANGSERGWKRVEGRVGSQRGWRGGWEGVYRVGGGREGRREGGTGCIDGGGGRGEGEGGRTGKRARRYFPVVGPCDCRDSPETIDVPRDTPSNESKLPDSIRG